MKSSSGSSQHRHSLRRSPLTPSTTTLLNRNGSSPIDFGTTGVPADLLHSLPHSHSSSVYRSLRDRSNNNNTAKTQHKSIVSTESTDNNTASPTLSKASTTKNVYATIVRQLDSSPSAVRRSFHHHSPKFPTTNQHSHLPKPLRNQHRSPNIDHIRHNSNNNNNRPFGVQPNTSSIQDSTFDTDDSLANTDNICSQNNSPNITKIARFSGSTCDSTDYSTLQYSPQSRDGRNISFESTNTQTAVQFKQTSPAGQLRRPKMNSKRYSM